MNVAPSWYDWGILYGVVALGATAVVLVAAAVARLVQHAAWSRLSWRMAVVALIVVLGGEVTGLTRGIGHWTRFRYSSLDSSSDAIFGGVEADVESGQAGGADEIDFTLLAGGTEFRSESTGQSVGTLLDNPEGSPSGWEPAWAALTHRLGGSTWWPGIVWLAVAAVLTASRVLVQVLGLAYRWRRRFGDDEELSERLRCLGRRLGLSRVRTVVVPGITGPIAFGVMRPTVGVPAGFTRQFDADQQAVMLAHELEHLAARDPAWYLLTDLVVASLWWHPLAWWSRRQLRVASELAADEASQIVPNGADVLAACLVQLGGRLIGAQRHRALGIEGAGFRSSLGRRVTRLLSLSGRPRQCPSARRSFFMRVSLAAAMLIVALATTGWSNVRDIPKGENMQLTLQQSWRHSLVAATLLTVFGSANLPAEGASMPDELLLGYVHEPEQKESDEFVKQEAQEAVEKIHALLQRLQQVERQMETVHEKGDLDAVKVLSIERSELKSAIEKLAQLKARKEGKKDGDGKFAPDSIDGLRERMKQLEAENAKLRKALEETRQKTITGSEKGKQELERAHKELMEYHQKLSKEHPDKGDMESLPHRKLLMEKAIRDKMEQAKIEKGADERHRDMISLQERVKQLGEEREKLKEKGRYEEAERLQLDMWKLAGERAAKMKEDHDHQKVAGQAQELGAMLKELREEVSRLRNEVSELRKIVGGDSKDRVR